MLEETERREFEAWKQGTKDDLYSHLSCISRGAIVMTKSYMGSRLVMRATDKLENAINRWFNQIEEVLEDGK
ncbi:hypothetical protein [Sigmofec virus UA08Rod_5365]|uniref:Uncharacterized protein n=1 Tax=Sigmofec virus UA08Rod_5365 TaxID=2929422 RepID=A0A976N144_9VIRU|nr:hypothetical protein [Sigmofec virus UA08Rod_5365]